MERVFIFGAGAFGIELYKKIKNKYDVIGFLDNRAEEIYINDIKVFKPDDIFKFEFDKIIIGNNSFSSIDKIVEQLIKMNVDEGRIDFSYVYKKVNISISDIFFKQHNLFAHQNKNSFYRYNLIIQMLAIENMYGLNDIGIELSKKYRKVVMPKDDIDEYMKKFRNLVMSFREQGYKENSFISLNKKGDLIDGTHRMALLICNDIDEADIRIINTYWHLEGERDLDWLNRHDVFTEKEIKMIKEKYEQVKNKLKLERCRDVF